MWCQLAAAPKRFDDLLRPELKGKIGFATSDTGSRVIGAMLATKGAEFVQKLKSQDITLHAVSGRAILDMVISGELGCISYVFLEPFAGIDVERRADQVGAYGCCSDQRGRSGAADTSLPIPMRLYCSPTSCSVLRDRSFSASLVSTARRTSLISSDGMPRRA